MYYNIWILSLSKCNLFSWISSYNIFVASHQRSCSHFLLSQYFNTSFSSSIFPKFNTSFHLLLFQKFNMSFLFLICWPFYSSNSSYLNYISWLELIILIHKSLLIHRCKSFKAVLHCFRKIGENLSTIFRLENVLFSDFIN